MTTVDQLTELHQRYLDLSNRFKAVWTFHQFLQGLAKIFPQKELGTEPVSFQGLYGDLKSLAKNLNADSPEVVTGRLDDTGAQLDDKLDELIELDGNVSPSMLRQFFDRVRSYDRRILVQLLRGYLYVRLRRGWTSDLLDKADFLATRLGEELSEPDLPPIERDPRNQKEVWSSLWGMLGAEAPEESEVADTIMEIRTLREAMTQAHGLDEFNELGLIAGYRRLKNHLADRFFYPPILEELIKANLFLRAAIGDFYQTEEERISREYQQVFELEREALRLDDELGGELETFRDEVAEFEEHVARRDLRLKEMSRIRARARHLIPRLQEAGSGPVPVGLEEEPDDEARQTPPVAPAPVEPETPSEPGERGLRIRTAHGDLIADSLRKILKCLEATSWQDAPQIVAKIPSVSELRIETREVIAFRRLHEPDACQAELEQLVLESAALRLRVAGVAESLLAVREGIEKDPEARLASEGRRICSLAAQFERRLDIGVQEYVEQSDAAEARSLQFLRMRLVRESSGLWLLLRQP